jgi:hypothetical protein
MVWRLLFGAFVLHLAFAIWLFSRAREGSPDRHVAKIQVLLASGMMFGNLPTAFDLSTSVLSIGIRVLAGVLLVATFAQVRRGQRAPQ